jgi:hypothetical protein
MADEHADTDQEHQNGRNYLWNRQARATESACSLASRIRNLKLTDRRKRRYRPKIFRSRPRLHRLLGVSRHSQVS